MCLPSLPKSFLVALVATAALMTTEARPQTASDTAATSVHVASVETSIEMEWISRWLVHVLVTGHAEVVIVDDLGNPVEGALVTGTFSGDLAPRGETVYGVTGPDGSVSFATPKSFRYRYGAWITRSVTFCVDDVSASLPYDPSDNLATCDTLEFTI